MRTDGQHAWRILTVAFRDFRTRLKIDYYHENQHKYNTFIQKPFWFHPTYKIRTKQTCSSRLPARILTILTHLWFCSVPPACRDSSPLLTMPRQLPSKSFQIPYLWLSSHSNYRRQTFRLYIHTAFLCVVLWISFRRNRLPPSSGESVYGSDATGHADSHIWHIFQIYFHRCR